MIDITAMIKTVMYPYQVDLNKLCDYPPPGLASWLVREANRVRQLLADHHYVSIGHYIQLLDDTELHEILTWFSDREGAQFVLEDDMATAQAYLVMLLGMEAGTLAEVSDLKYVSHCLQALIRAELRHRLTGRQLIRYDRASLDITVPISQFLRSDE